MKCESADNVYDLVNSNFSVEIIPTHLWHVSDVSMRFMVLNVYNDNISVKLNSIGTQSYKSVKIKK